MKLKRHQLLSYVLDNDIVGTVNITETKSKYVCICLRYAAKLMSDDINLEYNLTLAGNMQDEIEEILVSSLRGWLREQCEVKRFQSDSEMYEYRILWVTAMRDACLKADV